MELFGYGSRDKSSSGTEWLLRRKVPDYSSFVNAYPGRCQYNGTDLCAAWAGRKYGSKGQALTHTAGLRIPVKRKGCWGWWLEKNEVGIELLQKWKENTFRESWETDFEERNIAEKAFNEADSQVQKEVVRLKRKFSVFVSRLAPAILLLIVVCASTEILHCTSASCCR